MSTIHWPWAIVLCRFKDRPETPQPRQYFEEFYTHSGAGGACDYWHTVTSQALDITSSRVFGWFTMEHVTSELAALQFPRDREVLVRWGKEAAAANGIDLSPFRSVLVVFNHVTNHGAANSGVVIDHHTPDLCEFGFICHEMGHGFGFWHSWAAQPDAEYGDGWDLMSWQTTTFNFDTEFKGARGLATVGLNALNLTWFGAIAPARQWSPSHPDFSVQLTLDPLNQIPIGQHGPLVVKIPPSATRPARASGSTFSLEFRRKAGFDQAIPEDAVLLHELRTDGRSFLVPTAWARLAAAPNPNDPNVRTEISTPEPKVFVRVTRIDTTASTATIRLWDLAEEGLRKEDSSSKAYLIQSGRKRWITSDQVFADLGRSRSEVLSVPDGGLSTVPNGPDIYPLALVRIEPSTVPLNTSVSVIVHCTNPRSGAPIEGDVFIDSNRVAATNERFTYVFRPRRVRDPGPPPTWEVVYPIGFVRIAGQPDRVLDFGFPSL